MGRVGNISSDLHRKDGRGGVRVARLSKKDTTDKPKGRRVGARATQRTSAREVVNNEPLVIEECESVWEALGFSPNEAANLQARAVLMRQIEGIVKEAGWTQAAAAKRCGVSQPRINDLLRGRIDKFSIDALVNMATSLGRRVDFALKAA